MEQLNAIHGAIATWSAVLLDCFDGLITLTDVTGTVPSEHQAADIVVHYVPHGLGLSATGVANCSNQDCNNVLISSEGVPGIFDYSFSPDELTWVTLHELGHALGVGHATNLWESTDLMGYGWFTTYPLGQPVLSDCDVDAIAFVFAWALEGSEPYRPAEGPYDCSLD